MQKKKPHGKSKFHWWELKEGFSMDGTDNFFVTGKRVKKNVWGCNLRLERLRQVSCFFKKKKQKKNLLRFQNKVHVSKTIPDLQ